MQRVRIGLTGLAFVFLLVMLATVLVRPSEEAPLTPNMVGEHNVTTGLGGNGLVTERQEPLAELGVAPGNAETNNSAAAAGQSGAPAGQR
jgi:hypothetical protein